MVTQVFATLVKIFSVFALRFVYTYHCPQAQLYILFSNNRALGFSSLETLHDTCVYICAGANIYNSMAITYWHDLFLVLVH